jgi:hypothetical protein
MRVIPYVLLLVFILNFNTVSAQNDGCATDIVHRAMMQDAEYRNRIESLEADIQSKIENEGDMDNQVVYTIPVVVHVIHLGEAVGIGTNISDTQIENAIATLNDRWRGVVGSGVDVEIDFCLAVRDPNGNATTGINRVDGSAVPLYASEGISLSGCSFGAPENSVKSLSRWPVADYYNIWVVNRICNGQWGGWTYYPYGGVNDGATIVSGYMSNASTLLTHEVGHGFFAFHTFEGDGGNSFCPSNVNCTTDGDRICDTPPHKQGDCGSTNPCDTSGNWDNSKRNYMSYCTSLNRFTENQKTRMRTVATTSPRLSLLSSLGCSGVTGLPEISVNTVLEISPNPAHNTFAISLNEELKMQSAELRIFDVTGRVVYEQTLNNQSTIIDKQFSPGIYLVKVHAGEKVLTEKLVVE